MTKCAACDSNLDDGSFKGGIRVIGREPYLWQALGEGKDFCNEHCLRTFIEKIQGRRVTN